MLSDDAFDDPQSFPPPQKRGQGEAEVVALDQLAPVLHKWREEFEADHDRDVHPEMMGPLQYLSERSGIPVRRISAIVSADRKMFKGGMVGLSTADALLQAAGITGMLDRRINVVPNPYWSQEKWIAYMEERGCA